MLKKMRLIGNKVGDRESLKAAVQRVLEKRAFDTALAGGITTADGVTRGVMHGLKHGRSGLGKAVLRGLGEGAIYGTTLAAAEPLIARGLRRRGLEKK